MNLLIIELNQLNQIDFVENINEFKLHLLVVLNLLSSFHSNKRALNA